MSRRRRPLLRSALRAFAVASCLALAACAPSGPPDVLLVTLDTFRADRIGAYGATDISTPALDAFAAEGILFERAAAPMPLTLPSHVSILTGRYPREHGVLNHGMAVPERERTLAEMLREHGYATGGFVGVKLLSPASGVARGFDAYSRPEEDQRPASEVVPEALDWVATVPPDRPLFLWVHLFDPHLPYAPEEPWNAEAMAASNGRWPELDWTDFLRIARRRRGNVPAAALEHAKRLYDAEIEYTDHWVGRLVEGLRARGRWERTAAVVTADHGECFENGVYFEHADCMFEGAIRVPLMVALPGRDGAGDRVTAQASLIDVAPTLLEAAGLPVPKRLSGRDLARLERRASDRSGVLIQHPVYRPAQVKVRSGRQSVIRSVAGMPTLPIRGEHPPVGLVTPDWKYLRSRDDEELYRLADEPDESRNLADEEPEILRRLRELLRRELVLHPANVRARESMPDDLRETLEALGYL
ncbi:MAG TPA: sulfatase [Thermoanaerobaculia bacterium]